MSENQTRQDIGALWKKEGVTNGKKWSFLSGSLTIDGKQVSILIRKNDFKKEDKHPDYRIYPDTRPGGKTTQAKAPAKKAQAPVDTDDGETF